MWEISNQLQLLSFLRAVCLGGIFCLFYDVLRGIRLSHKASDFAVFWQDIVYFSIISPVTFLFLLATTNGELRLYVFFAIALGFCATRLTLSKIFIILLRTFFTVIFKVCAFLNAKLNVFFAFFERVLGKTAIIMGHFFKKGANSLKKGLKKR